MVAQINRHYIRTRPPKLWSRLLSYALFEGRPLTTKGQWINPFIFAHFGIEKRLPQLKKVKAPIFILGTGRSGTTVLGIVLSVHRDVGFLNEPKAMWHSIYDGEDLIGSYSRASARYRLDENDATAEIRNAAHRLYGAYLRVTFSNRVVDKYPEMVFRRPFLKATFPDAKFLFLARNGWDTCASVSDWSDRLGTDEDQETHDWWGADRRKWNLLLEQILPEHADLAPHIDEMQDWADQRAMAAVEWIVTMREGMALCEKHPDDVMHVNYESLCKNPRETLEQIASFAELREDSTYIKYGSDVLASAKQTEPFDLPECLIEPFEQTMRDLGYGNH